MSTISSKSPVGINGIGRIGKLLTWLMSSKEDLEEIVVSTGRKSGKALDDLATYLGYDSTYGPYARFISGFRRDKAIEIKNDSLYLNGKKLVWLNDQDCRVPGNIPWSRYGVELVFDTTGKMTDPTKNEDNALRGHLNNAKKVVLTAPFKIKNKGTMMPDDAVTVVGGVNFDRYDPAAHRIISNASCTTNCCAPPIKALVEHFGDKFISYALTTVHAATNSQQVLDVLPKDGEKDCRKTRSIINNIIPSTTGAANAVIEVIPEIRTLGIGSQASSLRVPTNTASIVILDISLIGEYDNDYIHGIFRKFSERNPDIMKFSDKQLVSSDLIGSTYSTIYDALFTHRRTTKRDDRLYTMVDLNFWYDNEFGYVSSLERLYNLILGRR
ncbi:MAG TPA: glyceraldehyde 3-phosphate dehydrogenase NAD-binding domain-containing protein [Spirochaetota bacterium]|nr:glyceraldehyde-3-phosphate dehydrogenase [Spirochaetota bacterium]HOD16010.1 glyceraldehyde 3-phosphate dehydrogenase NAD-binding domain-containing protein [Spirochaetota bacterium]HPG52309.1 glyceraldehyde 3-phosphate dehydrogenase NAD-binding domain-containing protein [Spirochaetota bacterium]HPN12353.1 glyceraldehyde 3-phosphate dehydrogenase NAD-binding domain-containing protein [Spirochaetota bacterium]